MNTQQYKDKHILAKTYGSDLWFCELCYSFMYWEPEKKCGSLRLRQENDYCNCLVYKADAKKPQPEIALELYEEEMTFFPDTPSEVVKMVKKSRVKIIPNK